tara:strand:- start:289 stop:897 length:609 start_codon:yes stop_codon:yes gene_type:complete
MKEIFISHAWKFDSLNRNNHIRCKKICDKLNLDGYKTWFDHYNMNGNIDKCIMDGIDNSKVVIICLTEEYINKINNGILYDKINDNCLKEWNYTLFKQKPIIPVIMEPAMKRIWNENGIIQMYLKTHLYIDLITDDYENNEYELLKKTLRKNKVYNLREKYILNINDMKSYDSIITGILDKDIKCIHFRRKRKKQIRTLVRI